MKQIQHRIKYLINLDDIDYQYNYYSLETLLKLIDQLYNNDNVTTLTIDPDGNFCLSLHNKNSKITFHCYENNYIKCLEFLRQNAFEVFTYEIIL